MKGTARRSAVAIGLLGAAGLPAARRAEGQEAAYPARPVRLSVGFPAPRRLRRRCLYEGLKSRWYLFMGRAPRFSRRGLSGRSGRKAAVQNLTLTRPLQPSKRTRGTPCRLAAMAPPGRKRNGGFGARHVRNRSRPHRPAAP